MSSPGVVLKASRRLRQRWRVSTSRMSNLARRSTKLRGGASVIKTTKKKNAKPGIYEDPIFCFAYPLLLELLLERQLSSLPVSNRFNLRLNSINLDDMLGRRARVVPVRDRDFAVVERVQLGRGQGDRLGLDLLQLRGQELAVLFRLAVAQRRVLGRMAPEQSVQGCLAQDAAGQEVVNLIWEAVANKLVDVRGSLVLVHGFDVALVSQDGLVLHGAAGPAKDIDIGALDDLL